MNTLASILTRYPNCRVTISSVPIRRKPRAGDRRHTKSRGWLIRRQQRFDGMYCTRRGRPVYEWVSEAGLPADQLAELRSHSRYHDTLNPYVPPTNP